MPKDVQVALRKHKDDKKRFLMAYEPNKESVDFVVQKMQEEYYSSAGEAWYELTQDVQEAIYSLSPTKGSVFTTEERKLLNDGTLRRAHFGE